MSPTVAPAKVESILAAIRALAAREEALGPDKAYDPNDPETNLLFKQLWSITFDAPYTPAEGDAICQLLRSRYPAALERMRQIGAVSENVLEKSCALKASAAAQEQMDAPDASIHRIRDLRERIAQAENGDVKALQEELIDARIDAFNALVTSYPYPTYQRLVETERTLLHATDGYMPSVETDGLHLVVEAGALPFTPIFSSILRHGGKVVGTISDSQAHAMAEQLVRQCETLGILEPGQVTLVQKTLPQIPTLPCLQAGDDSVKPYAVTLSQLVPGKAGVEGLMRILKQHEIENVIVRGGHQFTALLYEPLDGLRLPRGYHNQMEAIPKVNMGKTHCYNSSTLITSRKLERGIHWLPSDTQSHIFAYESCGNSRAC